MFDEITQEDLDSFDARLEAIKKRSKKGYLDDSPVALYYALCSLRAKGFLIVFKAALEEVERLYDQDKEDGN